MVKKILYFSDSKFPLAGLAGAIHTGCLPEGKEPEGTQLWSLPFLNLKKSEQGKMISLGEDDLGNKIYGLSVKGEQGMVYRLVESFLNIYKIPERELRLVDSGAGDNLLLLTGMLICRSKFLAPLGRFFAAAGIRKSYGRIVGLVLEVKAGLANLP